MASEGDVRQTRRGSLVGRSVIAFDVAPGAKGRTCFGIVTFVARSMTEPLFDAPRIAGTPSVSTRNFPGTFASAGAFASGFSEHATKAIGRGRAFAPPGTPRVV